jgi:hypothetical protein
MHATSVSKDLVYFATIESAKKRTDGRKDRRSNDETKYEKHATFVT